TQRTVSPGATWKVAVAAALSVVLSASSQDRPVRSHPAFAASVTVYVPGRTSRPSVAPSVSEKPPPGAEVAKANEAPAPSGRVCCSTTMRPSLLFVKTQRTVSPAAILNVAVAAALSVVLSASSQDRPVRSQPAFAASVTVYVPGLTLRDSVAPSVSE